MQTATEQKRYDQFMAEQSDLFAANPEPRLCDCWIGNGVVLCDDPDLCRVMAEKHDAEG